MFERRKLILPVIGIVFTAFWSLCAQEATPGLAFDATYVSADGRFTFAYPAAYGLTITERRDCPDIGIIYTGAQPIWLEVILPTGFQRYAQRALGATPPEIVYTKLRQWRDNVPTLTAGMVDANTAPEFTPAVIDPIEFVTSDDRIGAYASQIYPLNDTQAAAVLVAAVDLGDDQVVTIIASAPLDNGAARLAEHLPTVLAIAGTVRYVPPEPAVVALPPLTKTYSDVVGNWQTGTLTFAYPEDWFTAVMIGNLFLSNRAEFSISAGVQPGQVFARFATPDYNWLPFVSTEAIENCAVDTTGITPAAVIEAQMLTADGIAGLEEQNALYTLPQAIPLPQHNAALMRVILAERDMLVLAVDLGAGYIVSLVAFASPGEMDQFEDVLLAIADTMVYTPQGCQ